MGDIGNNKISYLGKTLWTYAKYQFFTKIILFLTLFPLFKVVLKYLISSSGRVSVTSGDYIGFIFSLQGVGFLYASLFVLSVIIAIDINSFIIISALVKERRINLTARNIFLSSIKSLKLLFKPSGIMVMLYIAIVTPLVGLGFSISITRNFKIPNFITDVIFNNTIYSFIYFVVMLILSIMTILFIFFFHYLIIDRQSILDALKKSYRLIMKHKKSFIKEFFVKTGIIIALSIIFTFGILFLLFYNIQGMQDLIERRFWTIIVSITTVEILSFITFMTVPILCHRLTGLFYKFNEEDGYKVSLKWDVSADKLTENSKMKLGTKVVVLGGVLCVLVFNILTSAVLTIFFDDVFKTDRKIDIIAHRGGDNLAAENSLLGLQKARDKGASWSEIDVQRTKDGYYVINHDATFSRLSGVNKTSSELNLKEIENLKIKDLFNDEGESQPVSRLEDFLEESKGKIGLFIELKGSTADTKMADDVVAMVKSRNMEKEVVILSLDYKLITYIEEIYPEMDTGFLYFFSIGDRDKLKGDILIVEEEEATDEKIQEIHRAGKKVIVWTVNSQASIKKFVLSNVDGIITDFVSDVKKRMKDRDNRSDLEMILDSIFE